MGETLDDGTLPRRLRPFSILERIDVGETVISSIGEIFDYLPFSILERIDVGETGDFTGDDLATANFQYPRTDRRG